MRHRTPGRIIEGCAAAAGVLALVCMCCVPAVTRPKPAEESERFFSYSAGDIQNEILRLERLLVDSTASEWSDTAHPLTREQVAQDLFQLIIHRKNPTPDYGKALGYARYLFQHVPDKRLYYSSWGRVLKEQMDLAQQRDSLQAKVDELSAEKKDIRTYQIQTRQIKGQIDSLQALVNEQAETVRKLRQLDVQMERQRSKIQ